MSKTILLTILCTCACVTAFAQDNEEAHNDVSFSFGAAVPTGSDTAYLQKAPMLLFSYGYRFNRFFQAEGGLQMAFGAANNQNPEQSDFGSVQGGDHELMIPFSGRFFIPLPLKQWQVSVGGGPTYLHYAETAPSDYSGCLTCTSRGGWGLQGFTTVRYFFGDNWYVGTTVQYVSASINGEPVGNIPGTKTTDHWANALFGVGLRF